MKPKRKRAKRAEAPNEAADVLDALQPLPGGIQAKALARVGSDDLTRLAWLLDWLNRPAEALAGMGEDERAQLEAEIGAFCEPIGSLSVRLAVAGARELAHDLSSRVHAMVEGSAFELEIPPVTLVGVPGDRSRYIGSPDAILRLAV
ncbi:MAG TPA: hypothetical protein VJ718_02740, partial [Candidatus Binataceae bacterium]|nr:hypothetical protein [Candidatus Binataceae bacterium]